MPRELKFTKEGEWKVKMHGKSKRRKWLKIHSAVDPGSGEMLAETTTLSNIHDGEALGTVLSQVPRSIKSILADGAYDGKRCRDMIKSKGAEALIPPPKNARIHNKDSGRDDAIRIIRRLKRRQG